MGKTRDAEPSETEDLRSRVAALEARRAALVAERDHYRDYYENSPDYYASIDQATGTIVECNETLLEAHGYERDELIGAPIATILAPESLEVRARYLENFTRTGRMRDTEFVAVRSDGTRFPVGVNATARRNADGSVRYSRGSARDISELKRMEEALVLSEVRFRRLAETMCLVPYEMSVDPTGEDLAEEHAPFSDAWYRQYRPDYIGAQIERTLGYPQQDWYRPGFWFGVLHPDDREWVGELYRRSMRSQGDFRAELRMRSADGRYVSILDLVSVKLGPDGRRVLRGVLVDLTEEKRAEEAEKRLMRELDHRVKNTHAMLLALAEQTLGSAVCIDDCLDAFDGRVASLARIHNAMAAGEWTGIDLHGLVSGSLAPFLGVAPPTISGPAVKLGLDLGRSLGMIFHELATNAVKYGALSGEEGVVRVRWTVTGSEPHRELALLWREQGGPPCREPTCHGYGLEFIRRLVPYELDGSAEISFPGSGLVCELRIPLRPERA